MGRRGQISNHRTIIIAGVYGFVIDANRRSNIEKRVYVQLLRHRQNRQEKRKADHLLLQVQPFRTPQTMAMESKIRKSKSTCSLESKHDVIPLQSSVISQPAPSTKPSTGTRSITPGKSILESQVSLRVQKILPFSLRGGKSHGAPPSKAGVPAKTCKPPASDATPTGAKSNGISPPARPKLTVAQRVNQEVNTTSKTCINAIVIPTTIQSQRSKTSQSLRLEDDPSQPHEGVLADGLERFEGSTFNKQTSNEQRVAKEFDEEIQKSFNGDPLVQESREQNQPLDVDLRCVAGHPWPQRAVGVSRSPAINQFDHVRQLTRVRLNSKHSLIGPASTSSQRICQDIFIDSTDDASAGTYDSTVPPRGDASKRPLSEKFGNNTGHLAALPLLSPSQNSIPRVLPKDASQLRNCA
jgi:hypothetical protein